MLKLILESLDGLAENIAALYSIGADGKYHLELEGKPDPAKPDPKDDPKLKEFRENNIKLMKANTELQKRMDDLAAKFKGIDPEEYQKMSAAAKAAAEKGLIDAGKIDEVVESRVAAMKESLDKKLKEATDEVAKLTSRLSVVLIDEQVATLAAKAGVKGNAIDLVAGMARDVFKLENEVPVPYKDKEIIYGPEDGKPLSMDGWIKGLSESKPFLFEASSGGGGGGGDGSPGSSSGTIAKGQIGEHLEAVAEGKVKVNMEAE